jgi:hypothetical protein
MKLNEITSYNLKSQAILNESWDMLTESQRLHVGAWEKNVWPLMEQLNVLLEAELSPKQIQDIFANAEKLSKEQGTGLTALGKAGKVTAEVSGKIKQEIDKLIKQAADSKPVANFDAQFEKLKAQLTKQVKAIPGGQKLLAGVDKWKDFATENPAKSAFVIGAMTSVLAFASGGIMSGAAIGFFIKLANNTIKGDKLSTAIGKGVKGAAIGALAGGLSDIIGDLVPPDVEDVIIASDGQTIDVSGLEAMSATSLEGLEPDAVEDLLKTQNALETAFRSADGDAQDMIGAELEKVSQKIGELGGRDELADYAGLEGQDLERDTTTRTSTSVDGDNVDSSVETVAADPVTAEELKAVGINFDTEPDISPEVVKFAEENDIDPDELQKMFQMRKAMDDAEFMGTDISANQELKSAFTNGEPTLDTATLPDGTEIQVGETFESEISTSVGGIEPPITFMSRFSIEGVDADGNPVYQITKVTTMPSHPIWDQIDSANLSPEAQDQLFQYMNEYTGVSMDSKAGVEQMVDTFKQTLAKSIGAAATAAAVGGWMADKEVKAGATDLDKKESRRYLDQDSLQEALWDEFDMYEAGFADMIKKAGQGAKKIGQTAAKGMGKAASAATTKAAQTAQRGVASVKKGTAAAAKELGQKVTVRKLNSTWKKLGEPTDTGSIANILADVGMSDEQIGIVGSQAKVELKAEPNATTEPTKKGPGVVDGAIDLPTFADEIKKAGLADKVKALIV